jgi:hypothetical protein
MPDAPRHAEARTPRLAPLLAALLALALGPAGLARAQDEPDAKDEARAKAGSGDTSKDQDQDQAEPDADAEPEAAGPAAVQAEIWGDPMRFELLENTFPELSIPVITPNDANAVLAMAKGTTATDPNLLKKFVQHYAGELTRHSNIESMLQESEKSTGALAMQTAFNAMLAPLLQDGNNARFRQLYLGDLMELAPKMLQGHLHTRTFFMVLLSRSKAPEVVPFLIEQLKADDQPQVVKMLAAVGLVNISGRGKVPLNASSQAIPAAEALSAWLASDPELFWPLKARALEAMGAMRMSTARPLEGAAELADQPFLVLVDPTQRADVRAWAGWALGMMDVPAQVREFNFALVAYGIGRAAADIGQEIADLPVPEDKPAQNLRLVERKADPLLRLLAALAGDPDLPRSGLANTSHAGASAARPYIRDIEQRIRAVSTSAIALSRSAGRLVPDAHKRLVADVQELKSFLAKNPPKDLTLYPKGPTMEQPGSRPAAPAGDAKGAKSGGAAGGSEG